NDPKVLFMKTYFASGLASKCAAPVISSTSKPAVVENPMQDTPAELAYFSSNDESRNYEADDENVEESTCSKPIPIIYAPSQS
ncbi:hypothetical protein C0992_000776, partial [Termitomyces sp. T32_za158]